MRQRRRHGPGAQVVLGLSATPKGSATVELSFNGTAGDASYTVERATGASGTFATITSVPAPAAGGTVTWTDNGLTASTLYRYRIVTVRGGTSSAPSGEISITTLGFGSFAATISQDVSASRTLYADTAYTISGFIPRAQRRDADDRARAPIIKGDFKRARLVADRHARRKDQRHRDGGGSDRLHVVACGRPAATRRLGWADHRRQRA
jgi:hypothetical protein